MLLSGVTLRHVLCECSICLRKAMLLSLHLCTLNVITASLDFVIELSALVSDVGMCCLCERERETDRLLDRVTDRTS